MEKTNNDIILNILLRLPYQSLVNCKLVCKPWRDLLQSNTQAGLLFMLESQGGLFDDRNLYERQWSYKKILHNGAGEQYSCDDTNLYEKECSYNKTLQKIDDHLGEPLSDWALYDMVGSCNGLVCLKVTKGNPWVGDPIYIINPLTGEHIYLPKFNGSEERGYFDLISGFGYNYSTDEYKVIRIYYGSSITYLNTGKVQVYTLGSGQGWRDKGSVHHRLLRYGVCANGSFYWLGVLGIIVSFDLVDEEFRLIPSPPSPCVVDLRLVRGYLSAIGFTREKGRTILRIWALKKKKNYTTSSSAMEESVFEDLWCWNEQEFSISLERDIPPYAYNLVAVTRSNQVLLLHSGSLFCYDPKTETLIKLWSEDGMDCKSAMPHLNTLVSLEALGEKSKRTKENSKII